jgi:anti-sigma B factor antagonist
MQLSALPPDFFCDVRPARERVILAMAGELDLAAAPRVGATVDELLDVGFRRIVIDLRELRFLDSAGVHTLLSARERAEERGAVLSLVRGSRHVHSVFELTGVGSVFAFDDAPGMA